MAKTRRPYSPEFRRQMVELVRAGRDPDDLAREFEPAAQSIRNWIARAEKKDGRQADAPPGPSAAEYDELSRLWRENKQLRVAGITYVPTAAGFLYLAIVLDAWSRKIVGWSMANHLRKELVLDAMETAVAQRRPHDVIHHSDQVCQYTSLAFGKRCGEAGVRPSMGSVGDACDKAMGESFLSTLRAELLSRRRFSSRAEARQFHRGLVQPGAVVFRTGLSISNDPRDRTGGSPYGDVARMPKNRPLERGHLNPNPNPNLAVSAGATRCRIRRPNPSSFSRSSAPPGPMSTRSTRRRMVAPGPQGRASPTSNAAAPALDGPYPPSGPGPRSLPRAMP